MECFAIKRGKDKCLNLNPLLVSLPFMSICHDGAGQFVITIVAELDVTKL